MDKNKIKIKTENNFQRGYQGRQSNISPSEDRVINLAFSSETSVDRGDYIEVLSHKKSDVDLSFLNSGRAPLLLDHDQEKQIGVIEYATIDADGVGRASVRFSKQALGEEVYQDVLDKIRANVSVGYNVNTYDYDEKTSVATCRWMPLEISIVSIPADASVGVGRCVSTINVDTSTEPLKTPTDINKEDNSSDNIESDEDSTVEQHVLTDVINNNRTHTNNYIEVKTMSEENKTKEIAEIYKIGARYGAVDDAEKAIERGVTSGQFAQEILEKMSSRSNVDKISTVADHTKTTSEIGLSNKEKRVYATEFANAVRALASGRPVDGLVSEVTKELAKNTESYSGRGLLLPVGDLGKRVSQFINGSTINPLSNTTYMADELSKPWFSDTGLIKAGVKVLDGVKGLVQLPVIANQLNITTNVEGGAFPSADVTATRVTLTPTPLNGITTVTNQMIYNSDPLILGIINDILNEQMAVAVDQFGINGLLATTGINSLATVGNPNWALFNQIESVLAPLNVPNIDKAKWLFNKAVEVYLKRVKKGAFIEGSTTYTDTTGEYILDGKNRDLAGYDYVTANTVPSGDIVFGKFDEAVLALYGVAEVIVNPYSGQANGETSISICQNVGFGVKRPTAFVLASGVTLT